MKTTPHRTDHEQGDQSCYRSVRRLVRSGASAGAVAAVCTTFTAAIARAADVSLDVNAEQIPLLAFAWFTMVGAALGVVLARLLRVRQTFTIASTALAGLTLLPAVAAPDDTATKAVLVAAHILAAAIIIPALGRRLPAAQNRATGDLSALANWREDGRAG